MKKGFWDSDEKKKELMTLVGMLTLMIVCACAVILAAQQYKLWKAERTFEKLAEATTVTAAET